MGTRGLLVLGAICAACGTIEGLDPYHGGPDETDASMAALTPILPPPGSVATDGPSGEEMPVTGDDAGGDGPADAGTTGDDSAADGSTPADGSPKPEAGTGDGGFGPLTEAGCACVGAAPSGWQGYVQLAFGDGGASTCVSPYATPQGTSIASVTAAGASCSPCTCTSSGSSAVKCQVQLGSAGLLCAGENMTPAPQGTCTPVPGSSGTPNGSSYGPTASGSCIADGGTATRPAPQTSPATVCLDADASVLTGCASSGQVCVVPPAARPSGSATSLCIYRSGVQTCPGPYTASHVVSTGVTDGRGCSACSCGSGVCPPDGFVQGFPLGCLGVPLTTFAADAGCVLGDNAAGSLAFIYSPSRSGLSPSCPPQGGAPTGGVSLDTAGATTYCCLP